MKKRFLKTVIGVVFVCILFVGFLYANNNIGMTSTDLEADIRSSQKIKDDWTLDGSVSNTMAAYISYPQDMNDHIFSVYVNRPGLSFGYFFRGGGTLSGIQRGIVEFTVEGYNERAYSLHYSVIIGNVYSVCCPVNISTEHIEFSRLRKTESVTL